MITLEVYDGIASSKRYPALIAVKRIEPHGVDLCIVRWQEPSHYRVESEKYATDMSSVIVLRGMTDLITP